MGSRIVVPPTAFELDPSDKGQARIRDEAHLAWIRTLPSAVSGMYPCEACHVRYGDPEHRKKRTGRGQKPDDCWTVPMTAAEHRSQHEVNEAGWWYKQGIDPLSLARQLYQNSGDTEAALKILRETRMERKQR